MTRLRGLPQGNLSPNRQVWLAKLAQLRQRLSAGKTGLTVEQILEEDRGSGVPLVRISRFFGARAVLCNPVGATC